MAAPRLTQKTADRVVALAQDLRRHSSAIGTLLSLVPGKTPDAETIREGCNLMIRMARALRPSLPKE